MIKLELTNGTRVLVNPAHIVSVIEGPRASSVSTIIMTSRWRNGDHEGNTEWEVPYPVDEVYDRIEDFKVSLLPTDDMYYGD